MAKYGKKDLIERLVSTGAIETKKEATRAVEAVIAEIKGIVVEGDELTIVGFGSFKTVEREARICRNPQTGEAIEVPAKTVAKFTASKNILG